MLTTWDLQMLKGIRVATIDTYLSLRGWGRKKEPVRHFYEYHLADEMTVFVPIHEQVNIYGRRLAELLRDLSHFEKRSQFHIVMDWSLIQLELDAT